MLEQYRINQQDLLQILDDGGVWDVPFESRKNSGVRGLSFSVRAAEQMDQLMSILESFEMGMKEDWFLENSPVLLERIQTLGVIRGLGKIVREEVGGGEYIIYSFPSLELK